MNTVLGIILFCSVLGLVYSQLSCFDCKCTKKVTNGPETEKIYKNVKGTTENDVCCKNKKEIDKSPPPKTSCSAGTGQVARCKKKVRKFKGKVNNEDVEMEQVERKCEVKPDTDPIANDNQCDKMSALDVFKNWMSNNIPGLGELLGTDAEDCYCSEEGCNGGSHVTSHVTVMAVIATIISFGFML